MEGDGVAAAGASTATDAVAVPSSPPHDPDSSPVGSPEVTDSHFEAVEEEKEEEASNPSQIPTLTDDLRDKIIRQVEYYFSDENLPTDKFLMKYVTKDAKGFVPIAVIASFRKMKKLTQAKSLIVDALKESSMLVVSSSGKTVRRLHPLPVTEVLDPQLCIVLVENLPEDHSIENIQRIFGEVGNIKKICIRDPHPAREPTKRTVAEKLLSGKLHALVEYETLDAAEKAVAMLNNEQDWRYGMRVKLLKRAVKPGQKNKVWRGTDSEKNSNGQAFDPAGDEENHHLSEHHDVIHDEEDGGHSSKEKNGYRAQNRRRGRGQGQRYRGANGQGHGTVSSSHGSEPLKPPPGPRMPDGTRGFSLGRGRPPA